MPPRLSSNPNLELHTDPEYMGLPVVTNHGPLILNYLDCTYTTLCNALNEHPRTLAVRFDLRLPRRWTPFGSNVISKFFESFKAQVRADLVKRHKNGNRRRICTVRYVWAKEKDSSDNYHYHVVLLLNRDVYGWLGDVSALTGNTAARIKKAWASALNYYPDPKWYNIDPPVGYERNPGHGLVEFVKDGAYELDRELKPHDKKLRDPFFRFSYLAKAKSKTDHYGDGGHFFDSSRK